MAELHDSAISVCQEAMALLRQEQTLTPNMLKSELAKTKVERACFRAYENCRIEVLMTHGWSFVKDEVRVNSRRMPDGRYMTDYPAMALKILGCFDEEGHRLECSPRQNRFIITVEPVCRISYIFDEPNVNYWSPLARKALVWCVAKNLAMEITGRAADAQLMASGYANAVQDARTNDARQSEGHKNAWGRNYMYDVMVGKRDPFDRRGI